MEQISKEMPQQRSRHMGLEYLRCLAAMMVVILHAWFMPSNASQVYIFCTAIVYSVVSIAVPLFVMMSGAFLILNERNVQAGRFWLHCFKKMFPLSFAFFVLAFFWQSHLWENYVEGKYSGWELFLKTLRWYGGGAEAPLWYLCMLPGLYGVVPLLARMWKRVSLCCFSLVALAFYGLGIYARLDEVHLFHPFSAIFWLGYFMLGAVLMNLAGKQKLPSCKVCLSLIILTVLVGVAYLYRIFSENTNIYETLGDDTYLLTLVLTLLAFTLAVQWKPEANKLIVKGAELSFLVYLSHVPCQRIIRAVLYHTGYIDGLHTSVIANSLFAVSSLIFAFIAAYVIHRVYQRICKAIVGNC